MNSPGIKYSEKKKIVILSLFLAVFIFHTWFVFSGSSDFGYFKKYTSAATLLAKGQLSKERISDFSPLYLYMNTLILKTGIDPQTFLRLIQIFLIFFAAFYFFKFLGLYFPEFTALFGTMIFLLGKEILIYEKVLEPEPFMIFFICAFAFHFSHYYERPASLKLHLFISSFFLSLTFITRANLFLMIIVIPFLIIIRTNRQLKSQKKRIFKELFIFLLSPALVIAMLWIRNYSIYGYFLPYYQNPGYIIFEGNNPNSLGKSAIYPPLVDEVASEYPNVPDVHHEIYRKFARSIRGKDLNIKEVNDFWTKKALNFIRNYPLLYFKRLVLKFRLLFHNYARHDVITAYRFDHFLSEKARFLFPFWIISVFALIGMVLNLGNIKKYSHLYALIILQSAVLFTGYVSSRQRIAIYSILIFFAISAITKIVKKKIYIIVSIFLLVFGFLIFRNNFDILTEENFLWEKYQLSNKYWIASRLDRDNFNIRESLKNASLAIMNTPWMDIDRVPAKISVNRSQLSKTALKEIISSKIVKPSKKLNYAILLISAGKTKKAEIILKDLSLSTFKFKRDFDHSSQPDYYLGVIAEKTHDFELAKTYFMDALKKSPGSPYALSKLYVHTGNKIYYEKLNSYFDRITAEFFLGRDYFNIGKYLQALKNFEYVAEKIPEYRKNMIYLAVTLGRLNRLIPAYNIGIKVIKMRADPFPFKDDFIKIFRYRIKEQPKNPVSYYYYGYILELSGDYKAAIENYSKGLELKPGEKLFKKRISVTSRFINN